MFSLMWEEVANNLDSHRKRILLLNLTFNFAEQTLESSPVAL